MDYGALLPVPKGATISGWAPQWLEQIASELQEIVPSDDVARLRERNEHLSAYLATLGILRCAYGAQIVTKRADYAKKNPPPDKGIKAWEAQFDEAIGELKHTYDLLTEIYEATSKRISVTQTNLRSRTVEATSIA